jgi:glycosyltransferase involved in cell wall biosynthesis
VHIALYSPNWPPSGAANGIVSYVSTVREYLIGKGHKVTILSEGRLYPSGGAAPLLLEPTEQLGGLDRLRQRISRRLDAYHGGLPGVGHQLAAQINAAHNIDPIDILEMEESFGWSDTVQRMTGIPVVTRLHGPYFLKPAKPRTTRERLTDRQRCKTEGRAVRSSLTLTAPTRAMMKITCENYRRTPKARDAVIPNPIQLVPEGQRWDFKNCDRNHILMVGRFDHVKGADTMLLAFERVLRTHPDARLTLVGPHIGIETGPGQIADFASYASDNLSPETARRVTMTGILTPEEIAQLRRDAFMTVVASRWENFPYALLEGLATGSPMISTDWPGSDEIVRHGETGILTPVGDPEALAQRIGWMFDYPEIAAQVGQNGLRHCAASFSIETVGSRLIESYEATLRNGAQ